ncbi:16S rRNA (uracil(1498)-N(3))-methyltransferase [Microlunatus ginsengisoli]|uniref:Ribosomal RNA small subunit methyltransferase E n=1 Tax=Microlunatus ginsengisoli TaxID=363863 RepID=A0ABP6ZPD1_9ACTN
MSDAVFLIEELGTPAIGDRVRLDGPEGRHAVKVRRIRAGEQLVIADGRGRGVRGAVVELDAGALSIEVAEVLVEPTRQVRWVAAQALAKGDRDELAIEMLTETGVDEVIPWQASRSISRWGADRVERGLTRWRSTVREAAKQSRRLRVPEVADPLDTRRLAGRVATAARALILHEEAGEPIGAVSVPDEGEVLVIIGPEGGIAPGELELLTGAGGRAVSLGDTVLRTSTAGVVALAALRLR